MGAPQLERLPDIELHVVESLAWWQECLGVDFSDGTQARNFKKRVASEWFGSREPIDADVEMLFGSGVLRSLVACEPVKNPGEVAALYQRLEARLTPSRREGEGEPGVQ